MDDSIPVPFPSWVSILEALPASQKRSTPMIYPSRFVKNSIFVAAVALSLGFTTQPQAMAQNTKPSKWDKVFGGIATALGGASTVAGSWQGGKTENNPFNGGYLNLTFRFNFSADGSYQEAAYIGGSQVMFAQGTYQSDGSTITFAPQQCTFSNEEFRTVVKLFPIPTDSNTQDMVSYSALSGGGQLSLKDSNSGEDWELKPFRNY
jgi:hypothetical protein